MQETIYDVITGKVTVRNLSAEEIAEIQALANLSQKLADENEALESKKATAKAAATAKLSALGLTTDDLNALGL